MKKYSLAFALCLFVLSINTLAQTAVVAGRMNEVFLKTDLSASGALINPWEITYGPDDSLWITESRGYKVYKMSPVAPYNKRIVLDLSLKSTWLGNTPASDSVFNLQFVFSSFNPQGGLAGLAIHPAYNAATPKKYVYISYVRSFISNAGGNTGIFYRNRVVRFTYNLVNGKLGSPVSICDTLPGSSDHNSQRMIIAPVNGTDYLFYAQGDMGAGQLTNQWRTNNAQNPDSYEGKILRFNLEPDADAGALDQWIPNDNPYNGAKQSAVWCMGIRNNQGFAYDSINNLLYGSSHGPYSDDEVNIIEPSRNYGHPLVIGYAADSNYDGASAGSYPSSSIPVIASEADNAAAIGASYKDPLFSGYARTKYVIDSIWSHNPSNSGWPSEAWSGLGLYQYSVIPGWKHSLLMAGLKWGRLIRTKLDNAGTAIVPTGGQDTVICFDGTPRYRDMAFGPGGKDIYLVMDNSNSGAAPSGTNNPLLGSCLGCVQKFTFLGYNTVSGTSAIPGNIPIAAGTPNTCENANTININATNANYWVPITDTNSNIVAEINANGNLLGDVTTSLYVNAGPVREQASNHTLYLDRNITITPQVQPSSSVSIRLYLSNAEFDALKNTNNSQSQPSGVTAIGNLSIFKNADACGSLLNNSAALVTTTDQAAFGADGYVVQASINSFSSFYMASVTSLLPVRALSFNASIVNNMGQLRWVTEDEKDTRLFTVERSINGIDFYPVTTQQAGNMAGESLYAFTDSAIARLSSAVFYYRLKLTGTNDKYSYSSVVILNRNAAKSPLSIRPNPVFNNVTVGINATVMEKASWQLTDITGKTILQHDLLLNKGYNETNINLSRVPAGVYYLKISGANISQSVKLQKL
ncbi:MAG: PQQ-dependent sugar dehydrogenase [Bacteroidota bacterium]